MRLLLPLLLLLPVAQADLIHVTPKQLDEALPIVDHAFIHVYEDEPDEIFVNLSTTTRLPIYLLNEAHDEFSHNNSIYVKIRHVHFPVASGATYDVYEYFAERISEAYPRAMGDIYDDNNVILNGNRSIDVDIARICMNMHEFRCRQTRDNTPLKVNGKRWNGVGDLHMWVRKQIMPYPIVRVEQDLEKYLLMMRVFHQHLMVFSNSDVEDIVAPLVEESNHSLAVSIYSDKRHFPKAFGVDDLDAAFLNLSLVHSYNKTYTGPITEDSLRTFLTTCTETI